MEVLQLFIEDCEIIGIKRQKQWDRGKWLQLTLLLEIDFCKGTYLEPMWGGSHSQGIMESII